MRMLRLAKWLIRLYPRAWRERYGEEFEALLEQHHIRIRTLCDIAISALIARLTWSRPGLWWFRYWAGLAVLTIVAQSTYTVVQQEMRWSANQPQVQMAEAIADQLASGLPVRDVAMPTIDAATSLDPFVIIYDDSGRPVLSTAKLDERVPQLPSGVLAYTRRHGRDIVTWQPAPGVRIAAVVVHYQGQGGGFVLAGRSLRVTEQDEDALLRGVGAAYVGSALAYGAVLLVLRRRQKHLTANVPHL
jgi:hypothetical protein